MAYTDKTYFLTKIKETDLNDLLKDSAGAVQDSYLTDAIKAADNLINGYLKTVTTQIPLTTVPESIKQCSYYIASYYLYDRISFNDIPERIQANYKMQLDYLKDIAAGKVTIIDIPEETQNTQVVYNVDTNLIDRNAF